MLLTSTIPFSLCLPQYKATFSPGVNCGMGRDHTLFALAHGAVKFTTKRNNRTYVNIEPTVVAEAAE